MSKYLLVLGAPDGATNASFQPIADAMAKGFGEPVPFVVWTDSQLNANGLGSSLANQGNAAVLLTAPFGVDFSKDPDPQFFLYVIANNDVGADYTRTSPGTWAMSRFIGSEEALEHLRGIIYVRTVTEAEAQKLPGTTAFWSPSRPPFNGVPPILVFQKLADANPTRLAMRQVTTIMDRPPAETFQVPVLNQALPGQMSISTQHFATNAATVLRPDFLPNMAEQMAVILRSPSSGGGPVIEPPGPVDPAKPETKPATAKQASFFANPFVLGAIGVGAYFLFFRKRARRGSSRRS